MAKQKIVDAEVVENTLSVTSFSDYQECIETIKDETGTVLESMFKIGYALKKVADEKLYEFDGYKDIYEFAEDKFNYKQTSVKNLITVAERYCDEDCPDELDDSYSGYSYSALVELNSVPKEEILTKYPASYSVKAIRNEKKLSQLSDVLKATAERFQNILSSVNCAAKEWHPELPKKYCLNVSGTFTLSEDKLSIDECSISVKASTSWYYLDIVGFRWYSNGDAVEDLSKYESYSIEDFEKLFNEKFENYYNVCIKDIEEKKKHDTELTTKVNKYPFETYLYSFKNYNASIIKILNNFLTFLHNIDFCDCLLYEKALVLSEKEFVVRWPGNPKYGIFFKEVNSDSVSYSRCYSAFSDDDWKSHTPISSGEMYGFSINTFEKEPLEEFLYESLNIYRFIRDLQFMYPTKDDDVEDDSYESEDDEDYEEDDE